MEKMREDSITLNANFTKFKTALVGVRYVNARQCVKEGSAGAEKYKILSLNLMDDAAKRSTDSTNRVCDVVDRWVMKLKTCQWQEDVIEFCGSKADIVKAVAAFNNNKQDFIIIMDDSTIDDNVLDYNGFGFDMLKKYDEINDFMILDTYSSDSIQYMYDKLEEIYKRG